MSREITLATEKTKLEQKFENRIGIEASQKMVADLGAMTKAELENQMLALAKTHQGIINTRNSDEILSDLKAQAKEHNRTYTEQLSANKDLIRYVSLLVSDKFGDELMDRTVEKDEE